MEFKFDTKPTYMVVTPVSAALDANLAVGLQQKMSELLGKGNNNYVVDLQHCVTTENANLDILAQIHDECYSNGNSLVYTGLQEDVLNALRDKELDESVNIAPTMQEAVDIISMEILERDLFGEEEA